MTLAVAAPTSSQTTISQTVPIVVLGTDALLAAAPATPVQLAHACLRAGFANVIPASWGDELIAAAVLRRLPHLGAGPVIQCSCPIVAHRLLSAGGDLRPALIALVSPPVAIARYVRTLSQPTRTRITYVGTCPGAVDDAIDIRMRPDALLAMLAERQIVLEEQPRVFESIIPPDRRRFRSQPGGVPTIEALWTELGSRTLVEIDGEDFVSEVAQQLLSGKSVLIDAAARLGCACSGAMSGVAVKDARASVVALEPPRSTTAVVEEHAPIDLELAVPAAPRTPIDVVAVPPNVSPARPVLAPPSGAVSIGQRISPVRGLHPETDPRQPRVSSTISPRPLLGALPVVRDVEGRSLPRAYIARRRSSPKGLAAIASPADEAAEAAELAPPRFSRAVTPSSGARAISSASVESPSRHTAATAAAQRLLPAGVSLRQAILIVVAIVMLALSMSAIVGLIVGRLVRQPPAATQPAQPTP